jgi:hypothetical protein
VAISSFTCHTEYIILVSWNWTEPAPHACLLRLNHSAISLMGSWAGSVQRHTLHSHRNAIRGSLPNKHRTVASASQNGSLNRTWSHADKQDGPWFTITPSVPASALFHETATQSAQQQWWLMRNELVSGSVMSERVCSGGQGQLVCLLWTKLNDSGLHLCLFETPEYY